MKHGDYSGEIVRRREDLRLLTGQGNYAADAAPPGMAVAIFLRSPHAHAQIGAIDTDPARTVPGVIAVYTAADLTDVRPSPGGIGFPRPDGGPAPKTDRPLLAADRVRFVGEPVALIIAETRAAGLEAAEAIIVDYAALPVVTEPIAALRTGAPAVWDDVPDNIGFLWQARRRGRHRGGAGRIGACHDARLHRLPRHRQLDGAARRLGLHRRGRADRGPRLASVAVRAAQRHGERQFPDPADAISALLPGDVGGSFGMKSGVHLESVLVAWAARRLEPSGALDRRPHRGISDRRAGPRNARQRLAWVWMRTGKFTALKLRWDVNLGAYVSGRSGWGVGNIGGIAGVYNIPFIAAQVCGVLTHTVPTAAYRGRRPAGGDLRDRAADRRRRAGAGDQPVRTAPPQPDPARGDAVQDRADLHL